jgi:fructokinase
MLNTAVSLGRSGVRVEMITELGDDQVGHTILAFLQNNEVGTGSIRPVRGFKTPVSLAFLDSKGNARYSFYKDYPKVRLQVEWPAIRPGDIVLFGSYYSLDPAVHHKIAGFVASARNSGAFIIYDPNFRQNHLGEGEKLRSAIEENISLADLVRGSDEDFSNIFGLNDAEEMHHQLSRLGCMNLIYTRGEQGAWLLSGPLRLHAPALEAPVISTIGAGDGFNAGAIFGILKNSLSANSGLSAGYTEWKEILDYGTAFASQVCSNFDNYIPGSWGKSLNL